MIRCTKDRATSAGLTGPSCSLDVPFTQRLCCWKPRIGAPGSLARSITPFAVPAGLINSKLLSPVAGGKCSFLLSLQAKADETRVGGSQCSCHFHCEKWVDPELSFHFEISLRHYSENFIAVSRARQTKQFKTRKQGLGQPTIHNCHQRTRGV